MLEISIFLLTILDNCLAFFYFYYYTTLEPPITFRDYSAINHGFQIIKIVRQK